MWIILSFIYAIANAFYTSYNDQRHINGYLLGTIRGFGVSLVISPCLYTLPVALPLPYLIILIMQGIFIGIYDSHLFFASARYGSRNCLGFTATSVLITIFLWWTIEINDFIILISHPSYFITLMLVICGYTTSYWQIMKVNLNKKAEQFLYPAVFALALMSITTRYIAIHGGTMYAGIIYYLTFSCFVSGIYNLVLYSYTKKNFPDTTKPTKQDGFWLIFLSTILIAAKTAAIRLCTNPGYVVAVLLVSPFITGIIKHRLHITPALTINLLFLILLLILTNYN